MRPTQIAFFGLSLFSAFAAGCNNDSKLKTEPSTSRPGWVLDARLKTPPNDATRNQSGLIWKQLSAGSGTDRPKPWDHVRVSYHAWLPDGELFDSSRVLGSKPWMDVDQTIPGWSEALQEMVVGEVRQLWVPGKLAYEGVANRPQGTLIFELELQKILRREPPPALPMGDTTPPPTASKVGAIKYIVLREGTNVRPNPWDEVAVRFTAWDSNRSVTRTTFYRSGPLRTHTLGLLPGFRLAVSVMGVGGKNRLWIPAELAADWTPQFFGKGDDWTVELELVDVTPQRPLKRLERSVVAASPQARQFAEGIRYVVVDAGTEGGPRAQSGTLVSYFVTGFSDEGYVFLPRSAEPRAEPFDEINLTWQTALATVFAGGKIRIWVDPRRAEVSRGPRDPSGILGYELELVAVKTRSLGEQ